jgi:hypothetical protein
MASLTLNRRDDEWLDTHSGLWVEAGLISSAQALGIKGFEHDAREAPQRLTLATEVASYVGSVLALMGGAAVIGKSWDDLSLIAQLGLAFGVVAVGFVTGTWLVRFGQQGTRRLGSFLWAVGTGGVAMGAFAVMKEIDPDNDGAVAIVVGASVFAVSVALWRNLARPVQLVTAAIGLGITLGGLGEMTDSPDWVAGLVLMSAGFALAGGAATRKLEPRQFGLSIGAVAAYSGGFLLASISEIAGPAVALAIAILVLVFGLRERLIPLLVLGVAGSLIATGNLIATAFTGALAAFVVTLLGFAIVVTAIGRTIRRPVIATPDPQETSTHSAA